MSVEAFEILFAGSLHTLLPDEILHGSKAKDITFLEVCGDKLFIGCRDGTILKCGFHESSSENGKFVVVTKATHICCMNDAIIKITAVSVLNQLLVLSNEVLSVLHIDTLAFVRKLKVRNVNSFCLNENPLLDDPFTIEICVGSPKKIHYVHLKNDQLKIIRDFPTSSTIPTLAMDGVHVCFASGLDYYMLNILTGGIQQLFSRDSPQQYPVIRRILREEFLLSGPGGLGVFVSAQGFSEKPPIQFPDNVTDIVFQHPYIIASNYQGIHIYSGIDQQCKQTIETANVQCLVNGDGRIFASTSIDLFALLAVSWEIQLDKLLVEHRLEEALQLASNTHIPSSRKEEHQKLVLKLQQQVALQRFSDGNFTEAMELFESCVIDPRLIIELNVEETFSNKESLAVARNFIVQFLERWRLKELPHSQKTAVDTALLKHMVHESSKLNNADAMLNFIKDCCIDAVDVISTLKLHQRLHCLATYYAMQDNLEEAFAIWDQLMKGEVVDVHFPGHDFVAEYLTSSADITLIWKFSGEILKKDQLLGAKIFIDLFQDGSKLPLAAVCDHLDSYPISLKAFLEFLVNEKQIKEESVTSRLAIVYINEINLLQKQDSPSPGQRMTVNKLRSLLRTSKSLDLPRLLDLLDASTFPHEHAIVCGRLGQHSAAINIFIVKLQDFDAAEEYCACVEEQSAWNALIMVCATPCEGFMFDRMIDLLRRRPNHFDAAFALSILPESVKIDAIAPFLNFSVREMLHEKRMKQVEKSLSHMDNITYQLKLAESRNKGFMLPPTSYCCVCRKKFQSGFVRFPNGVVAHVSCAPNKHVCPLTGHLFQIDI